MTHRDAILLEINAERDYQDGKYGGAEVDDRENGPFEWMAYISKYSVRWFPGSFPPFRASTMLEFRACMIKVAALAVAAVEQYDRKRHDQRQAEG